MSAVKIPTKVQKRSGFDKSHHNALSQKVGTITPILVDEVIPNSKVYLRYAIAGSLPPLATDTYMKCYYDVRAFFVPFRLLWGGFESWFSNYPYNVIYFDATPGDNVVGQELGGLPYLSIADSTDPTGIFGRGTLLDYLGYKYDDSLISTQDTSIEISLMPLLCYHRVCDDWFRQKNITVSCFARPTGSSARTTGSDAFAAACSPFISPQVNNCVFPVSGSLNDANCLLADNVSIFSLRQCNYDYDYFTNALPSAQLGNPLTISTAGGNFSIAALRVGNSLQQFAELNQLCGTDTPDVVKARYGANLSMGIAQKAVYLGGARIDIASRSVEVQSNTPMPTYQNPFVGQSGASAGRAIIQGTDILIDDFVVNEPGYIMVVGCIVPKVTYGSGVRRYLRHYIGSGSLTDMANPLLQNVGNQPIYQYELNSCLGNEADQVKVFGYTDRYAEFMSMEDEVHGELAKGGSLQSFVAQRGWNFSDYPTIGTNFLTIPTTALNNVTMVSSAISNFGFYGQFAFEYKVSQPLAQYSLPSLQNPSYEHGKTVMVHRGGFRF